MGLFKIINYLYIHRYDKLKDNVLILRNRYKIT